jgi:hypothetical protein
MRQQCNMRVGSAEGNYLGATAPMAAVARSPEPAGRDAARDASLIL